MGLAANRSIWLGLYILFERRYGTRSARHQDEWRLEPSVGLRRLEVRRFLRRSADQWRQGQFQEPSFGHRWGPLTVRGANANRRLPLLDCHMVELSRRG